MAELFQCVLLNVSFNVCHQDGVIWFKCIIKFLANLVNYARKLVDESQTVVEVHISCWLRPGCSFEITCLFSVCATLLEVKELWVAIVNLNEVGMLIHQMQYGLVFFFCCQV